MARIPYDQRNFRKFFYNIKIFQLLNIISYFIYQRSVLQCLSSKRIEDSFLYFLGLECVSHSFAYVAHFVFFLRDVWIRTKRAAVANRRATNLSNHLPIEDSYKQRLFNYIDTKAFVSVPLNRTADGFSGIPCAFLQTRHCLLFSWGGELYVDLEFLAMETSVESEKYLTIN
jgi:hypothetical protein